MKTTFLPLLLLFPFLVSAQMLVTDIKILETPTGNIEGTLLCPYSTEKVPVVLIIAGSGPTDRNGNSSRMMNNSLKLLAEGLKAQDIASLRYDKRGIGKSSSAALQEVDLRFDHYIEDVIAWIELLKKDQRFNQIIIAGHSEGSLIGMIACQKAGIDKYISIAGAGYPAADILRKQFEAQSQSYLTQAEPILSQIEKGHIVDDVPPMLNMVFRKSVQPYMISWFKYNPQQEIAKLSTPILIIQGSTDIQVSIDNAEILKQHNEKSQLAIIEGMNHILKEAPSDRSKNLSTYSQPNLPLHPELLPTIINFIAASQYE